MPPRSLVAAIAAALVTAAGPSAALLSKTFEFKTGTVLEVAAEIGNALLGQATVGFKLLFARAAHADAHLHARQVLPHALEAGQRVFKLREFHRDISRPWTLEMLASAAGTSRSRLIAAAQRELGTGIFNYMTRIRMQEAARLLVDTSMSVGRIAWQVGYQSEAAFSIAFKRYSGEQPRQFRAGDRRPFALR